MLTHLKVAGFKNLVDVDVAFGPFTCVAGANGVGKSNLFDAIQFLSGLADKPLMEAALSVRSEGTRASGLDSIFHRVGDRYEKEMRFEVEMIVPPSGVDDLGQEAQAAITFLRYELTLGIVDNALTIQREHLGHITLGSARSHLAFPHRPAWRKSVVTGRRTSPFISTETVDGKIFIKLHQDMGKGYLGGGRPRRHVAEKLPRTVLSDANAAENATAVLARREMQSWQLLQLEPSALRAPDSYSEKSLMETNGAHLPAVLARLAREASQGNADSAEAASVYARVANRLAELIEGVQSICVDADDRRELLTLMLTDNEGTQHEARSLSDGTLRFLALAILESDPATQGVLCLEEPENGIHPERIPAMLQLLRDISVDTEEGVGPENPLRQVIVNTHSPAVVGEVRDDDLLLATTEIVPFEQHWCPTPSLKWMENTWRAEARRDKPAIAPGVVVSYLNPHRPKTVSSEIEYLPGEKRRSRGTRVIDRPEIQMWLPGLSQS